MDALLARLKELSLPHEPITHDAVMTVEAQAQALQAHPGALTKNLFLKDKKGRLYVVTALPDTKVDLKVLSARLGAGKGGIRMAPDELLPAILGVALGSVTPLAVAQPTAQGVVLLVDMKLKSESAFYVHPLDNRASLLMTAADLEKYLSAAGRQLHWVDLEADPKIDRENPPDLKTIADAATPLVTNDEGGATAASAAPAAAKKQDKKKGSTNEATKSNSSAASRAVIDVYTVTDSVVDKVANALSIDTNTVDGDVLRKLRADVVMEFNALRNAAYAAGYRAAQDAVVASLKGQHN